MSTYFAGLLVWIVSHNRSTKKEKNPDLCTSALYSFHVCVHSELSELCLCPGVFNLQLKAVHCTPEN